MSNLRVVVLAVIAAAAAALVACPATNTPQPFAPPQTEAPAYTPGGSDAGSVATPTPDQGEQPAGKPDGSVCTLDDDCASGVCEGPGCDEGDGRCAPKDRACTKDLRQYCGCDGKTFGASGSCPGARYEFVGSCEDGKPDGAACLGNDECTSGSCEGQGCGDDAPGTCVPKARRCTRDLRPYCGCDGKTFRTSGTCPGQRYSKKGEC
jgi:hypothetical protein